MNGLYIYIDTKINGSHKFIADEHDYLVCLLNVTLNV